MLSYEKKVFSQNGEDGILEYLDQFVDGPRTFLEIGWSSGVENCCRNLLINHNYSGTGVDVRANKILHDRFTMISTWITMNDVEMLLDAEGLEPTVFSLDIDSFDWHLLNAMLQKNFRPKIICHEYNSILGPDVAVSRKVDVLYNKYQLYGASLSAYKKILTPYYNFVTVDSCGVNAFWIRKDQPYHAPSDNNEFIFLAKTGIPTQEIFKKGLDLFVNEDDGWEYV
jgi:hypothetical protein